MAWAAVELAGERGRTNLLEVLVQEALSRGLVPLERAAGEQQSPTRGLDRAVGTLRGERCGHRGAVEGAACGRAEAVEGQNTLTRNFARTRRRSRHG